MTKSKDFVQFFVEFVNKVALRFLYGFLVFGNVMKLLKHL